MFILHVSNKTENLLAHLAAVIENDPLSVPLQPEVFMIQSQGMERWLAQQLAGGFGVFGNFQFLFPGKFFSTMAQAVALDLDDQAFSRSALIWHLEALLRSLDGLASAPLTHYLEGNSKDLKRYQLARQLAQVFDQYQIMRADMLSQWQQGVLTTGHKDEAWQADLWKRLIERVQGDHRGSIWLQAIQRLEAIALGQLHSVLPERINIFGLNTMPPLFLNFLQALSKHCHVHMYLLNPAQDYWADLPGRRQIVESDSEALHHPLLICLGQQGQEFQELLLEQAQFELQLDSFEDSEASNPNNLQVLQSDILNNITAKRSLQHDNSISFHACHSRLREVQVLKDRLLHALEIDADLELRHIVVMAPDILVYEPFIRAVFSDMAHAIADRNVRNNHAVLDLFIRFLHLTQSRFGWKEILDFFQEPWIYQGFGLNDQDLQLIVEWVERLNIRWAQSAEHKQQLGLPPTPENTWQSGLERLLMGYAISDDAGFVQGVLPYSEIEGALAQALGGLHDFLQLMFKAAGDFSRDKTLTDWSEQLLEYSQVLLSESGPESQQLLPLFEILSDLEQQFGSLHEDPVSLEVIISWLEDAIAEQKSSTGFLRGQLTFCSMLPMRSIPFKVIALLGMNEGEFPKVDHFPGFDLIGAFFRKGDRSRRSDDRYQFLEILLSARQQLIVTYVGLSNRTNAAKPPAVVVSELQDCLALHYYLDDLLTEHPLQAFSSGYFNDNEMLFSYSGADCRIATAFQQASDIAKPWWQGAKTQEPIPIISIQDLMAFFKDPQSHYLRQRLDFKCRELKSEADERELFEIGGLEKYILGMEWIEAQLHGQPLPLPKLLAQGRWLPGAPGEILYQQYQEQLAEFTALIDSNNLGERLEDQRVELQIGEFRISGVLSGLYQQGSLFYRYANIKGKDFFGAWLHHLIINQVSKQVTYLIGKDQDLMLLPNDADPQHLNRLLQLYCRGMNNPKTFFVEPAFAYIQQQSKLKQGGKVSKPALDCALEQLNSDLGRGYYPSLELVLRGVPESESLLDEAFIELCENTLLPLWEKRKAGSKFGISDCLE